LRFGRKIPLFLYLPGRGLIITFFFHPNFTIPKLNAIAIPYSKAICQVIESKRLFNEN
jgi:hypothetical protein